MSSLSFEKREGLGNDFVLIDLREQLPAGIDDQKLESEISRWSKRALALCDRRRGIGADGLLLALSPSSPNTPLADVSPASPEATARARMVVINADGSRPEMCGNGLRCFAHAMAGGDESFLIQTDHGLLHCAVDHHSSLRAHVTLQMGPARIGPALSPQAAPQRSFLSVDMGNPHAVHIVGEGEDPKILAETLGRDIEHDTHYPQRTNVEFVQDRKAAGLHTWVWERGCGITQACGTGACAVAVAAVHRGLRPADSEISVQLPGGELKIQVPKDPQQSVVMRGPARRVFAGTFDPSHFG